MKKILILCTGNSCRSQIAEGFFRYYAGNLAQVYSAGIETHGVNPQAVRIMLEAGIDISVHTSNQVEEYFNIDFDYVITVCDHAHELCPLFPGKVQRFHSNFPDPAKAVGTEEEILEAFRKVRDMIDAYAQVFVSQQLK